MTVPDIVLTEDELRTVTQVLTSLASQHQAMAFGSRVCAGAEAATLKTHADLDIALVGPPLEPHDMFALRDDAFSESDLPFRVDISMYDDLPQQWRDAVRWVALRLSSPPLRRNPSVGYR